jgi:rhodanese-related sulfurtransferase
MADDIDSTPTTGEPFTIRPVGSDRRPVSIQQLLEDTRSRVDRVEPETLEAEQVAGAHVVDIRPDEQRQRMHVPGAVIVERNVLEWRLDPASPHCIPQTGYDRPIIIVCNEGYSSTRRHERSPDRVIGGG